MSEQTQITGTSKKEDKLSIRMKMNGKVVTLEEVGVNALTTYRAMMEIFIKTEENNSILADAQNL